MRTHLYTFFISLSILFIFSNSSFAGPQLKICINKNCKKPSHIEITDNCWSKVKALYVNPFATDKDEQDNIANSIALIETDVYKTLAQKIPEKISAEELYKNNSLKNNYKNIKSYLSLLFDHYLVKRHFMRSTITAPGWTGYNIDGLILQSLNDSQLYILKIDDSKPGLSPAITNYNQDQLFSIDSSPSATHQDVR